MSSDEVIVIFSKTCYRSKNSCDLRLYSMTLMTFSCQGYSVTCAKHIHSTDRAHNSGEQRLYWCPFESLSDQPDRR
ncbi:hypothetical protein KIN20_009788 [Parelaphostrongylus tenuis]|uniref:Uncharacterized protein n=1 Tax=Parelaphostrongylus tenuis TaxID=148309 RepID=A0AAD5QNL1_PARTN|nr:hypothetical protein KIN20_009788 [Parelaphostrongylus tenuis]